jgi:hypothetical protein
MEVKLLFFKWWFTSNPSMDHWKAIMYILDYGLLVIQVVINGDLLVIQIWIIEKQ